MQPSSGISYFWNMKPFKHKVPIAIRFKDIDKMGHANNANYLTYIEEARIKYFEEVVGTNKKWSQVGLIVARNEVDYKAPIFFHDSIFVYTRCSRIGTKSLTLEWVIVRERNEREEIVAQGVTVIVCYDYAHDKTIALPDGHRQLLTAFEGL